MIYSKRYSRQAAWSALEGVWVKKKWEKKKKENDERGEEPSAAHRLSTLGSFLIGLVKYKSTQMKGVTHHSVLTFFFNPERIWRIMIIIFLAELSKGINTIFSLSI